MNDSYSSDFVNPYTQNSPKSNKLGKVFLALIIFGIFFLYFGAVYFEEINNNDFVHTFFKKFMSALTYS